MFDSSTRMNRRRALALAGGGLAAGAFLAACGGNDDSEDEGQASAGSPTKGGTLRISQTGDIVLNTGFPFVGGPQNRLLSAITAEGLVRYNDDIAKPELVLAETFEYSGDHTRLNIKLKPGLTYPNGASVTTDDVFFGIDFLLDPKSYGVTLAGVTTPLAAAITSRKKIDDRTMEFTFDRPRFDMTGFFVGLPITHAASFPKLLTAESVQTTGPYSFKSWTPNVGYSLVRNPNWHGASSSGAPYLDGIEVKEFADEEAMGIAFEARELDVAFRLSGAVAKRFRSQIKTAPRIGGLVAGMVLTNPLLQDKRVRQALFYAIDRKRIADELGEGFYPATSQFWPEYSPAFDKTLETANYDPARAKSLLKEAGFSQSKPLLLEYSPRLQANVQVMQENFAAVGVNVQLVPLDSPTVVTRSRLRQWTDLFGGGSNLADPIPASALQGNGWFSIPNFSYQESPELAAVLNGMGTVDPLSSQAKDLYARFNKFWLDDPWLLPLEPSGALDAVASNVQGFGKYFILPLQSPDFGSVWMKT